MFENMHDIMGSLDKLDVTRVFLYSAHDTTLAAVLEALNVRQSWESRGETQERMTIDIEDSRIYSWSTERKTELRKQRRTERKDDCR